MFSVTSLKKNYSAWCPGVLELNQPVVHFFLARDEFVIKLKLSTFSFKALRMIVLHLCVVSTNFMTPYRSFPPTFFVRWYFISCIIQSFWFLFHLLFCNLFSHRTGNRSYKKNNYKVSVQCLFPQIFQF